MATYISIVESCKRRRNKIRVIPGISQVRETSGAVEKTPQYLKPRPRKSRTILMATMTDSQQVTLTPRFEDKKKNPARVDGVPEWFTDNTDVLALTPAADGLSCVVAAVGPLTGDGVPATVTMKADADLGQGVTDIISTTEFEITGGQAVTVTMDVSAPTEQP